MILKEIISFLEQQAPPALAESYDNSGLITGKPDMEITGAIICLDSTEAVIQEAISKKCNLVIAHHPIVFTGLKKLNGKNYVERTIIMAIQHNVAIYAIHTNLDNVRNGVNGKIAEMLGLEHTRILSEKRQLLQKLVVFVPVGHIENVRQAMFDAGAGKIGNYDECSFSGAGEGTFRPGHGTNPFAGQFGIRESAVEARLEVVLPAWRASRVISAMKEAHPYEEVAFDLTLLENGWDQTGAGLLGHLPEPQDTIKFLERLKSVMKASSVRYTNIHVQKVRSIAVCGGSGSFLLETAVAAGADLLITADFKYHQFFDADGRIIIADIGHFESEQFTMNLLNDWLSQKFPNFASHLTEVVTNPVHYL